MSKKQNNVIQKMENTTMKNNATINNRGPDWAHYLPNNEPDWANNVRKHPIHGPPGPVRAIRNIMKNHREGKITNAQRNADLNARRGYNKKRRLRWFTDEELKAREKAKKEKENQEAGLNNNFFTEALQTNSGKRVRDLNMRMQKFLSEGTKEFLAKQDLRAKNNRGGARKTKIKRKKHKKIHTIKKRHKKRKGRRKKGGHHGLVLLAGAAGMKVYNSLTKKKRQKKKKRKTKRK